MIRVRIAAMFDASEEAFRSRSIARRSCRLRNGHQVFRAGKQESIVIVIVPWNPSGGLPADAGDAQAPPQTERAVPVAGAVNEIELGLKSVATWGSAMGTVKLPVPVCRSGENVSPMPCRAPPPCGVERI